MLDLRSAALAPVLVLGAALAVRLTTWGTDASGVVLSGDSDSSYHVLQAERWLAGAPGAPWYDAALDWPEGARVPWPPLFTGVVAIIGRLVGGAGADRVEIARAAAPLPVALGLIALLLVVLLARRLRVGSGWVAGFLVAVLPAAATYSRYGDVDHHCAELVLFCALLLALTSSTRSHANGWKAGVWIAVLSTVAFWTWMGSTLHVVILVAGAAACYVAAPRDDATGRAAVRAVAVGGLLGGALLAGTAVAFVPHEALWTFSTTGLNVLHVVVLVSTGAWATCVARLDAWRGRESRPWERALHVMAAAGLVLASTLAWPQARRGIAGGLTALAASNPWYENIAEFRPLVDAGVDPLGRALLAPAQLFGLVPALSLVGLASLARRWRGPDPEDRAKIILLATAFAVLVPAALLRRRFGLYAVVPMAIAAEQGLREVASFVSARLGPRVGDRARVGALAAGVLAAVAPTRAQILAHAPLVSSDDAAALRFIGALPVRSEREAVLAPWARGHLLQFFANRPVVASPFGTEGGAGALEDTAAFWFSTDGADGEAILARRRVGLVLIGDAPRQAFYQHGFAPPGTPIAMEPRSTLLDGRVIAPTELFWRMVPNRLYFDDGAARAGVRALAGFRLVYETPATSPDDPGSERRIAVFERVDGARVTVVGASGRAIRAEIRVVTNAGRVFVWGDERERRGDGPTLRLPYCSGRNGAARAGAWTLGDGIGSATFVVHEEDVLQGRALTVDLRSGAVRREDTASSSR